MKLLVRCFLVLLVCQTGVFAGGKADVKIKVVNERQWPVHYQITITPPLHHHAYLDAGEEQAYIAITVDPKQQLQKNGLLLSKMIMPEGTFDEHVKATVLRGIGVIDLLIDVQDAMLAKTSVLTAIALRYQLCDEQSNACFRPETVMLPISPPYTEIPDSLVKGNVIGQQKALDKVNEDTWAEQLSDNFNIGKNNTALMFLLLFAAGILSVATPCVYPMLPITSMLIVKRAQGNRKQEKLHALAYVIGIISTYMLLGIVAGMTGGAFNSVMQSAWANMLFAVFFAFFAISLLGYYEFSFLQDEVSRLDRSVDRVFGYSGTWLMGCVAGLVISPCVGPLVFAVLLQVADTIALRTNELAIHGQVLGFADKLEIVLPGGLLMAGFGLGVALPFFVISLLRCNFLPKAGYWMNKVKYAFGLLILYFAYGYFEKAMGIWLVPQPISDMLVIALLMLWIATVHLNVFGGADSAQCPGLRLQRFTGAVSLLVGGWLLISGLNYMPVITSVEAGNIITQPGAMQKIDEHESGIAWIYSLQQAKSLAKTSGKPVFIDFYAAWCANCVAFSEQTVKNPALNETLRQHAIALKIIDGTAAFENMKQTNEHRYLKIGLPYFAILDSHGTVRWSGTDFKATQTMIQVLKTLHQEETKTNGKPNGKPENQRKPKKTNGVIYGPPRIARKILIVT